MDSSDQHMYGTDPRLQLHHPKQNRAGKAGTHRSNGAKERHPGQVFEVFDLHRPGHLSQTSSWPTSSRRNFSLHGAQGFDYRTAPFVMPLSLSLSLFLFLFIYLFFRTTTVHSNNTRGGPQIHICPLGHIARCCFPSHCKGGGLLVPLTLQGRGCLSTSDFSRRETGFWLCDSDNACTRRATSAGERLNCRPTRVPHPALFPVPSSVPLSPFLVSPSTFSPPSGPPRVSPPSAPPPSPYPPLNAHRPPRTGLRVKSTAETKQDSKEGTQGGIGK
jgi:hypothetical protein